VRNFSILFLLLTVVSSLLAIVPPVDTAGPLTVRLEGPAEITETAKPVKVAVIVENAGDATVKGTVRVQGIDGWRAEPASQVPFSVGAKGSARLEFAVTLAELTYNAFYPIHAYAEFEQQGQRQTAHPILVVPVKLANPPQRVLPPGLKPPAAPAPASPAATGTFFFAPTPVVIP